MPSSYALHTSFRCTVNAYGLRQDRVALPPERYTALVLRDGVEVFRRRLRVVKE